MKITCEKHGEVEVHPPNKDGNVFCPTCMCEAAIWLFNMGDVKPEDMAKDELGYPLIYKPYIPLQVTKLDVSMGVNVAEERARFLEGMEKKDDDE